MAKYRKKPVEVEAIRWMQHGDDPDVEPWPNQDRGEFYGCEHCGCHMADHGRIKTLEGWHIVCPGDWIITGIKGEKYPCKDEIFLATYDEAGGDEAVNRDADRLDSQFYADELERERQQHDETIAARNEYFSKWKEACDRFEVAEGERDAALELIAKYEPGVMHCDVEIPTVNAMHAWLVSKGIRYDVETDTFLIGGVRFAADSLTREGGFFPDGETVRVTRRGSMLFVARGNPSKHEEGER